MRRTGTALIAAIATALLLGGCAVGTGGAADDDADYDADAELSGGLSVMGFSGVDEVATSRVDLAEAALGDVEVKLIEGDLDIQQFLSAVASGEPPAVVYADRDQIGTFASRGAIIPLDDCIDGEGIDTGDVPWTPPLDQVTLDGKVYGIPEFNTVQITHGQRRPAGGGRADRRATSTARTGRRSPQANRKPSRRSTAARCSVIGVRQQAARVPAAVGQGQRRRPASPRTARPRSSTTRRWSRRSSWRSSIYDDQGGFSAVKAFRDSADFFGEGNQFATNALGAMPMEQWYVNVLNDVSPDAPMAFDTVRDTRGRAARVRLRIGLGHPQGQREPRGRLPLGAGR